MVGKSILFHLLSPFVSIVTPPNKPRPVKAAPKGPGASPVGDIHGLDVTVAQQPSNLFVRIQIPCVAPINSFGVNMDIYCGDCLELMKNIPDGSVDLVLTDPPYGTTACKWDSVIPFEPMWEQLNRIIKPNGAICLFGSEPFSSALRMSNIKNFKYDWYWQKTTPTGFLNAKKQPLRKIETISVFYSKQPTYNPQKTAGHKRKVSLARHKVNCKKAEEYHDYGLASYDSTERYPTQILQYKTDRQKCALHPTQKPVGLLEYLIRTYTNEGETVLDFTMGSGSTGVACVNTGRKFIGIELDEGYFNIAKKRIEEAQERVNT